MLWHWHVAQAPSIANSSIRQFIVRSTAVVDDYSEKLETLPVLHEYCPTISGRYGADFDLGSPRGHPRARLTAEFLNAIHQVIATGA